MLDAAFATTVRRPPAAADGERAERGIERWLAALAEQGDGDRQTRRAEALARDPAAAAVLEAVFGNSPFLTLVAEQEPVFALRLLQAGPDAARGEVWADLDALHARAAAGTDPGRGLRHAKRQVALLTALADIAHAWSLDDVTGCLSEFARRALRCACAFLLGQLARSGHAPLAGGDDPADGTGYMVIGMGKLGAGELNYSSDIDLIVFYEPERLTAADPDKLPQRLIRLTRGLVKLMSERTGDGYVFRTDLRLRPDPGSTPPAISTLGAEVYYETMGQNWERAAMIKARPVAGDLDAGARFLRGLQPFVWRKNLDFAAIQDIHSIKRQIHAHRGGGTIAVKGHNIKLGRGGIREIEFFVQTQQLIWGGRQPELRVRGTVAALDALARTGKIGQAVASELTHAYRFLRRLEHRLQMVDDEQTHTLPDRPDALAALGTFLGYRDRAAFEQDLRATLQRVEAHYAELFEDAPALGLSGARGGNLVFTGSDVDPDTLDTLARLGFANPQAVDAMVRGWHHGRARSMRSARARELLTELMPALLEAFAGEPDPDAALIAFDRFLAALPSGVALLSLFHAQPHVLRLVTQILGMSPRLGAHLARRPSMLDSVLFPDFAEPPPPSDVLAAELGELLGRADGYEERLDLSRRWANDRTFQVGTQSLLDRLDADAAAIAWSNVAEAALRALLPAVEDEFARRHGRVRGCEMAIVALGKLGSQEMTATSDLDLIFVYATPPEGAASDGDKPLAASQYFARLSQRLINALTSPTAEGLLYAVDMRLRPSGKAGPIAVSFRSFCEYQTDQAWTWERMALTRARAVAGPPALCARLGEIVHEVLRQRRNAHALRGDVAEMRERMAAERAAETPWDVKNRRGGLIDVEFLCQYLQLRHGHDHPGILSHRTGEALARVERAGLVDAATIGRLRAALGLWQAVQGRLRLTLDGDVPAAGGEEIERILRRAMNGLCGLGFEALQERMDETAAEVRAIFANLIESPAADGGDNRRERPPADGRGTRPPADRAGRD
jgi:glutamate-ammonia-ligase adenylyltransferase